MTRFLADEDLDGRIIRGIIRRMPEIDLVRVQDVGLRSAHDRDVLEFAAQENRILLTRDLRTMSTFALERIEKRLPMPGMIRISQDLPIRQAIEEIILIAECSHKNEWNGKIIRLPLR